MFPISDLDSLKDVDPQRLCVVEESPDFPGELAFQVLENSQFFYSDYRDWISRYFILSQPFTIRNFVKELENDSWHVVFLKSCRKILENYDRWELPLHVEGFQAPGGGSLFPYQSWSLVRALERAEAESLADRLYFWGWCPGAGKATPLSEPVLTPTGWRTMGDLRPGDFVIGSNGQPTRVVSVHPQGIRPVYRVEMNDGTFVRCDGEHLWNVRKRGTRRRGPTPSSPTRKERIETFPWKTLTTKELMQGETRRWQLPTLEPVIFADQPVLPVDPYVLGVFLGDGSWGSRTASITTDKWIIEQCGWELRSQFKDHPYCGTAGIPNEIRHQLIDLGLAGLRSWEKHVPNQYLTASPEDRLALLQGLLDTDGHAAHHGVEFSTTSEALRDAVADLVRGLGGKATVSAGRTTRYTDATSKRISGRESWRIHISMMMPSFRLPRKLSQWTPPTKYPPIKTITSVIEEGVSEEQVCIVVDAPDNLYVTRGHTITHNSIAATAGSQELFNRGLIDLVLVFTTTGMKLNLCDFYSRTTQLTTMVNDGAPAKRKANYRNGSQVFVLNYEKAWVDFDELAELVSTRRTLFALDEAWKIITDGKPNKSRKAIDDLIKMAQRPIVWPMSATVVDASPFRYRDVFSIGGSQSNPLGSKTKFEARYCERRREYRIPTKTGRSFPLVKYEWDYSRLHDIRHRVAHCSHNVRKTDAGVRDNFRGLQIVEVPVQLSDQDDRLYGIIQDSAHRAMERGENLGPYFRLLRYACTCPAALTRTNEEVGQRIAAEYPRLVTNDHCAKLEVLADQVESIRDSGDKVVVFIRETNLGLFFLRDLLAQRKIRHVVHYGVGQSDRESQRAQTDFKTDPDITVFLTSDAGAHGLNLPEARFVISFDVPYSYDLLQQRFNRIDRADSVLDGMTAYVYLTENSVEERIWRICNERRELAAATLGTVETLEYTGGREDLQYLIFG